MDVTLSKALRVKHSSIAQGTVGLRDLVRGIRDELLSTEDTVCLQRARLVTEAYRCHEGEAVHLKRARACAHVLRHMDLDLESNPVFAANTSSRPRAWMLVPEYGFRQAPRVLLENEGLEGLLDGHIPPELLGYWADWSAGGAAGIGHLAVDLDRIVHEGLEAMLVELGAHGAELDAYGGASDAYGDASRREYRQAMGIALRAVIDWSHRCAEAVR
jgi:hypothetical protein